MIIGNCSFADDVLYDLESNTWVRLQGDGVATVGINSILSWLGGPIGSVTFKALGSVVERGNGLGSVEGPRHFDIVRSPVTGRILRVNESLSQDPRPLNHDPYVGGWFAKLEPLKREQELRLLTAPATARERLQAKITELRIRCFAEFPDHEMYEIGTECSAVLVRLDDLLSSASSGAVVHLVSDDPNSQIELTLWGERTGNQILETRREGNLVHYIVKKA